jgi:hypothetical protein
MQTLETVAQALNDNNPCLAAIALVHAQFPPLPVTLRHGEWQKPKNWQKAVLHI